MVQSIIVVSLQTQGHAALVQIFALLAARADELEAARQATCGREPRVRSNSGPKNALISWSRWKVRG